MVKKEYHINNIVKFKQLLSDTLLLLNTAHTKYMQLSCDWLPNKNEKILCLRSLTKMF
jgi:hypothetical protein